jgi:hypothetical protein
VFGYKYYLQDAYPAVLNTITPSTPNRSSALPLKTKSDLVPISSAADILTLSPPEPTERLLGRIPNHRKST